MSTNAAQVDDDIESIHSIDPDLPETEENASHDNPKSPIPASIKLLLFGLIILIAFVVVAFFSLSAPDADTVSTQSEYVDPISVVNPEAVSAHSVERAEFNIMAPSEMSAASTDPTSDSQGVVLDSEPSNGAGFSLEEFNENLVSLRSSYEKQDVLIAQLNETIARLQTDELSQFEKQFSSINADLAKLREVVSKQYAELKTVKKREVSRVQNRANSPPFSLVSIDVWNNSLNAVIFMKGATSFVQSGDERAGWKIVQIMRPECILTEDLSTKRRVKLCKTS